MVRYVYNTLSKVALGNTLIGVLECDEQSLSDWLWYWLLFEIKIIDGQRYQVIILIQLKKAPEHNFVLHCLSVSSLSKGHWYQACISSINLYFITFLILILSEYVVSQSSNIFKPFNLDLKVPVISIYLFYFSCCAIFSLLISFIFFIAPFL